MALPFLLPLLLLLHLHSAAAGRLSTEFLRPSFNASNYLYIDQGGAFLASVNDTFRAAVHNPAAQPTNFYFSVIHFPTDTVVWSANRNSPVTESGLLSLTSSGLSLSHSSVSAPLWSTPPLRAPVASLRLLETGNLLLLNAANATLWQSFDHPTDTLLPGQPLVAGASLTSPVSATNLSEGDYRLLVTAADAILQWSGSQQYWSLSTDARSIKDYNADVTSMTLNDTGFYLLASDGQRAVFEVPLPPAGLRFLQLDAAGRLHAVRFSAPSQLVDDFVAPSGDCELPFHCGALGLCIPSGTNGSSCQCPTSFGASQRGGCLPADGSSLDSTATCQSTPSYLSLGSGVSSVGNKFARPASSGGGLAACQNLCNRNCSCLGFFYRNSSRTCFLLQNQLGSLFASASLDAVNTIGYIKAVASKSPSDSTNSSSSTALIAILLPSIATFLLVVVLLFAGIVWWRRKKKRGQNTRKRRLAAMTEIQLGRQKSWAGGTGAAASFKDDDDDEIWIPGLPTRFSYAELQAVTGDFVTHIGSGGFGDVYKGMLPDKTEVAVKRIGVGVGGAQGRREFCTEIAVIGSVHHVNLVRLRGFCAQGSRRLLVYEYMNRGSLDRSLFAPRAPVLEWGERMEIAIGAARGLAYLHSGCDHKIIHCDVKPENILLADGGQTKISDFGLAKLLAPEQSGLFTTMRGTRGYLAPEWLTNSAISDRTDVYSYGMVLLELVRGRKNSSGAGPSSDDSTGGGDSWSGSGSGGAGGRYFPMAALEMHERGRYAELADPRLQGRANVEEVERAVRIALCCLHEEPALRPSMAAVVGMLEGTLPVPEPRVGSLGFLRLYGRGFAAISGTAAPYGGTLTTSVTSSTTSGSASYMSSQQVSGPR